MDLFQDLVLASRKSQASIIAVLAEEKARAEKEDEESVITGLCFLFILLVGCCIFRVFIYSLKQNPFHSF